MSIFVTATEEGLPKGNIDLNTAAAAVLVGPHMVCFYCHALDQVSPVFI